MEQSLMEKLTILADSAKYDVACTSRRAGRQHRQLLRAGLLPRLYGGWPLREPFKGADDQLLLVRLQLLRQPQVQ